jgi:hypothetical protein
MALNTLNTLIAGSLLLFNPEAVALGVQFIFSAKPQLVRMPLFDQNYHHSRDALLSLWSRAAKDFAMLEVFTALIKDSATIRSWQLQCLLLL